MVDMVRNQSPLLSNGSNLFLRNVTQRSNRMAVIFRVISRFLAWNSDM